MAGCDKPLLETMLARMMDRQTMDATLLLCCPKQLPCFSEVFSVEHLLHSFSKIGHYTAYRIAMGIKISSSYKIS